MDINPKHCIYKREGNNMDWWDTLHMSREHCVPENNDAETLKIK